MNARHALLASATVSLLLTGCPLTDHYTLMSDMGGASSAGADDAGTGASGASAKLGGASGMGAGNDAGGASAAGAGAGEAGEAAQGGAPNGGSAGIQGTSGAGGACATNPQSCAACSKACNAGRQCVDNTCQVGWVGMKLPPDTIVARSRAAHVAMGKSVFFWGGLNSAGKALDDGAIYTPKTDTWVTLPKDMGSPSPRIMATAVWTGSLVVVYGGTDAAGSTVYKDGAIYDPAGNSWTALPAPAANVTLGKRSAPYGFWDGMRVVFWGGLSATGTAGVPGADRFDLTNWSVSPNGGDPGALAYPATAFDGSVFYLQGGQLNGNRQDKVYSYTSATNSWASLSKSINPRSSAFGAWDGTRFVVWGGRDDNIGLRNDGKSLSGGTWTALGTTGAPSARMLAFRRSGWSFSVKAGVIAILGGQTSVAGSGTLATGGATYDAITSEWTTIADWPSGEAHEYGMGVWTGEEFVLWGGRDANMPTTVGERWAP